MRIGPNIEVEMERLNEECELVLEEMNKDPHLPCVSTFSVLDMWMRKRTPAGYAPVPFESLGVGNNPYVIPVLARLAEMERVVRTFTDVFVSVHRGVVTLRDLEIELVRMLNARRVRRLAANVNDDPVRFDDFGMGSLLRQSCVIHYFQPPPEMRVIPDVRSQDVLSHLCDYRATNQTKLSFLSYLLNKLKIPSLYHGGILLSEEYFSSSSSNDEMQIIANVTNARKCRMFAQLQKSREELASASRDTATSSVQKKKIVPTLRKPVRPLATQFVTSCSEEWSKKSEYRPSFSKMRDIASLVVKHSTSSKKRKKENSDTMILDTMTEYAMLFCGGKK